MAAYERATNAEDVRASVARGTLAGIGLTGTFTSIRDGDDAYDDENLGPRRETTLRRGDRVWQRNANGNVRELTGYLKRRALTERFIDEGTFLKEPARTRFAGWGTLNGKRMWRLEVNAAGGEPETLWIESDTGLETRLEYLEGDGPMYVDYADFRDVQGHRVPFRSTTTDGNHQYDVVALTTTVDLAPKIDPATFAPLVTRRLETDRVHVVPLIDRGGHVGVTTRIGGKDWFFLLDTGSAAVLVDDAVAKAAGVASAGAMEVRGAARTGGIGTATLPLVDIDGALMRDVVVATSSLGPTGTLRYDGILGYPFFAAALVEFDFGAGKVRFGPPGSFVPDGTRVALDVDRELTEATVRLEDRLDAPVLIDTGNSGEMLLYGPFLDAHPGFVPFTANGSFNYGIGGANRTYRTSLGRLHIGDTDLYQRAVDVVLAKEGAFADRVDAGNVGLGILRNFVVTFDVGNGAMYLRHSAAFDDGRGRRVSQR